MGQKLRSNKVQDKFFSCTVTIAYLKENSKVKDKFFLKILTQIKEKLTFLAPKWGVNLYAGKCSSPSTREEPWFTWYACHYIFENPIRVDICRKTASSFLFSNGSANTFQTVVLSDYGKSCGRLIFWRCKIHRLSQNKLQPGRKFSSNHAQLEVILESLFHWGGRSFLFFTTIEKTEAEKCLSSLKKILKHILTKDTFASNTPFS